MRQSAMHLLQHRCALPLLTQPAPRPHCTIDVGLHAAPVLPITTEGSGANGAEASGASSSVGRVRMSNASGRMPCFSAAPVACVQAPSHALHPLYFHAQAALSLAPAAAAPQPQLHAARRMPAATLPRRRARHVSTNAAAAATNTAAGTSTGAHSSSRSAAGAAAAAAADPVVRARLGDSDDDDDGDDEGGARAADAGADAVVAVAANDEELALLAEQQSDGEDSAAPPPPLPRLPAAVVGPSVTEQLEYFQRHLGCKRLSSSMSSSGSGELDAPAHAVSAAEFESEALNDVPEDLLAGLLQEDERLRQREMMEDLTGERLLTLQVARSHTGRDAASASAASAAAASTAASPATSISLALFPTGALMEELALAELSFHSIDADVIGSGGGGGGGGGGSSMATPLLQVTQLHSTPLDSTIRQLCLTTPVPAPPSADLSRPQLPAAMPLIVSRSTCQMFVHTITFDPAAASSAAAAASASAGADSGAAPAAPAFASLLALDSHCFTSPIVHMCANPWLPSEVAFLLQDASIWLWNMQELSHERIAQLQRRGAASASNEGNDGARAVASMSLPKRRLTHIPVSRYWHPSLGHSILLPPLPWGRICFTPHARSLVLVLQQGAVQVDIRAPYATSRASRALAPARGKLVALPVLDLSRQQLFSMAQLREVDERSAVTPRLYAASVSPANPFHLALVSSDFLMLVDVRAPSVPLIEWRHHQGGEPPTHIEWLDDRHKCATCSPHDAYFLTHNCVRNEVTLYHYTFSDVAVGIGIGDGHHSQPGPLSCVASTLHSSFTPLRLPSLVHTEQRQRQRQSASGSVSDAALDMPNPLVGVRAVADPRLPASVGLWHLLQLSEYGALVSQAFQHRHDDASDVDVATIVPIQIPPDAAVVPADAGAPAAAAESDEASGMDIDDGSEASSIAERKYRGGSSAAAATAAAAAALSQRAVGAAAASDDESVAPPSPSKARASLHVLLPSTPTSSVAAAGLSASPSPQSSPPSLAALLATPERYERPWVQKHEIKPYRAVNLRAMLQDIDVGPKGDAAVAGGAGAGAGAEAGPGALDSGPPMSLPVATTFAHLLALLIPALNGAHELVRGYLALPKTLSELTHFLLDQGLVPAQVLASLAPQALAQAPPDGSEAPLPRSRDLSAPSLHAVAQLVSECMHAFVHAAAYGLQSVPAHMPFHRERWDALLPALLASQPAATSAARKRRRNLKISASQSREDDGDAHGHGQGPAIEPLNPFAPSFPQPIFPVFHVHLALSRFAHHHVVAPSNGTVEEEDSASLPLIGRKRSASAAAAAPAQCTCGTQSLVGDASCCCVPLCACLHCMRLHATLFTTSPTVLHTPWPHERAAASAAAAAAFADTQPDASQPSWSQVSASPSAPMCVSSFLTPAKHASFGGSRGAASLGPVADLSQDIDFLMSQGTEGEADPMATQPLPFGSQEDSDAMDDKLDIKRRMVDSKKPLAMGAGAGDGSDAPAPGGGVMFAVAEGEEGNGEAAADEEEGGAAAAQPADPNGVLDMLGGMGESWRQYADILQEATAAGVSGAAAASASPSAAAAAGVAEASVQLAAREADLSEWNASLFRGWLVSHELAPDPAAMALAAAQMAEDTRGATLDTMEDPVRDDPDD